MTGRCLRVGFKQLHQAANMPFFMTQEITVPPPQHTHTLSVGAQKKELMENNKLSPGHVNLDVNRRAIMF